MSSSRFRIFTALLILTVIVIAESRKHRLTLTNDKRKYFSVSTFGFLMGGTLQVAVKSLSFSASSSHVGFSLTKTPSDSVNPYAESTLDSCPLDKVQENLSKAQENRDKTQESVFTVVLNGTDIKVIALCNGKLVYWKQNDRNCSYDIAFERGKPATNSFNFSVNIFRPEQEGLYTLYFHDCLNSNTNGNASVSLDVDIVEQNQDSYLSAGDIPLPQVYFLMSFVFFVAGCCWIFVLRSKKQDTFKIHYLMGLLVFVKSCSLLLHGVNYHFISKDGSPIEAWAVLYYITHLLKGALLFITIVLIGTGWAFIKHILSDKDKKIFMIVIPLQVLANVAEIIMEESEEGESQHTTWREVFILVDLLCCGAILFPVVWSIRHLQEASQTDGKAAINLEKLKLFRHFYVMIVCYIYFTRIIVFLLKITVPFRYEWLDELFREGATLLFFVLTGYKFMPAATNPYFRLSQEDDMEMDTVLTQTGITENISKTLRNRDTTVHDSVAKRESSHEYD